MKISIINLGCDKNQIDGEKLLYNLKLNKVEITSTNKDADIIIINTCAFIESAKNESIETIIQFSKYKKVIVTGCLAKRYNNELKKELKEAELISGLSNRQKTLNEILKYLKKEKSDFNIIKRISTKSSHTSAIKISEGCNNKCSYCAIPLIRGKHRSINSVDIINEAKYLLKNGIKELIVVAQDTTAYKGRKGLPILLSKLSDLPFKWIRIMYCHPLGITDELIEVIKNNENIVNYIDMPIQHISDKILLKMNRKYNSSYIKNLISKIRETIPDIALRTTFITGFPHESREDFQTLLSFIKDQKFERMGAFAYSDEENTKAKKMKKKVNKTTALKRLEKIILAQNEIIFDMNNKLIGSNQEILIDEIDDKNSIGRTYRDAPEVDCNVLINKEYEPGSIIKSKIINYSYFDLIGK